MLLSVKVLLSDKSLNEMVCASNDAAGVGSSAANLPSLPATAVTLLPLHDSVISTLAFLLATPQTRALEFCWITILDPMMFGNFTSPNALNVSDKDVNNK